VSRTSCLVVLIAALAAAAAPNATAGVISMDFEGIAPNAGNGPAYLNAHGVTLSNVSPSGPAGVVDIFNDSATYQPGSLWINDNFLSQDGRGAPPCSYTLNFSTPLSSISFDRIATPPNLSTDPQWSATAFVGATAVGSVGEALDAWGNAPAHTFSLTGNGITSLVISANGFGFTGIGSVPLDNFVLTTPEPSTVALAGFGLISLSVVVLRRGCFAAIGGGE
jgi:hypothetical protein